MSWFTHLKGFEIDASCIDFGRLPPPPAADNVFVVNQSNQSVAQTLSCSAKIPDIITVPVRLDLLTFSEVCQYNKNSNLGPKFCYKLPNSSLHTILKAYHDTCHPHEDIQVAPDQVQVQKRALEVPSKSI